MCVINDEDVLITEKQIKHMTVLDYIREKCFGGKKESEVLLDEDHGLYKRTDIK